MTLKERLLALSYGQHAVLGERNLGGNGQYCKDPGDYEARHALRYDSVLTVTDGKLDRHCPGCGAWDSDSDWNHPVPPLCVFSISDFIPLGRLDADAW